MQKKNKKYNKYVIFKYYIMFLVYIWLYTLFLVFIWWFFIISKIHAFKFKNFSTHIKKVTYLMFIFLATLSILWYVLIFMFDSSTSTYRLKDTKNIDSQDYIEY